MSYHLSRNRFFTSQKKCIHFNPNQNNKGQQKYNIHLKISFLHPKTKIHTLQPKFKIAFFSKTRQMLSINIERVITTSRLIITMTMSIIHKFFWVCKVSTYNYITCKFFVISHFLFKFKI